MERRYHTIHKNETQDDLMKQKSLELGQLRTARRILIPVHATLRCEFFDPRRCGSACSGAWRELIKGRRIQLSP